MGTVTLFGLIRASTKGNLEIIIFKVMVYIHGTTEGLMMVLGLITRWKAMEYLLGLMVVFIKASTSMTRKKARAFSPGLMVANTMDSGRTASRMVKAFIQLQAVNLREADGLMVKEFVGYE